MRYGMFGKSTETANAVPAVAAVLGKNIAVNNWFRADLKKHQLLCLYYREDYNIMLNGL